VNIFFIGELIDRQKATGLVPDDRVHLTGFSGGASLIYQIVATPGFPHAINSIATVAGAIPHFSPGPS
jgi:poly(3-hydroxybutyrate) depolymerase